MLRNNDKTLQVDAVVVGSGILGLMLAKRLVDLGQKVALVEKSTTIADGASSINHGWVHQGSGSAVTADSPAHAQSIVKKMQYGFNFFKTYAPECFDEPFNHTYAITASAKRATAARKAWKVAGIDYAELSRPEFEALETGLDASKAKYFFRVPEARINNRLLFMKLFSEIRQKGAEIFMGAEYQYENEHEIRVVTGQKARRVHSPLFFYATGVNLDATYEKFTGQPLGLQFCKSHLLYLPRMTSVSVMGLDPGTPIIFNHGDVSVVNRSFDEVEADSSADMALDAEEVERSLKVLYEFYPKAKELRPAAVNAKAFLKPFASTMTSVTGRHSAEQSVFEPRQGHIFALPGKMTAAPFVADNIIKEALPMLNLGTVTRRPFDTVFASTFAEGETMAKLKRPAAIMNRIRRGIFTT